VRTRNAPSHWGSASVPEATSDTLEARLLRLAPIVRARLRSILPDASAVDDVLQDTLLTALRHRNDLDTSDGRILAWLLVVARNRAIDWLRRSGRDVDPRLVPWLAADEHDPAPRVVDRIVLEAALALLPAAQREVIIDVCVRGLPAPQVAETLGVAPATVRTRLHYGLARLRSLIEDGHDHA